MAQHTGYNGKEIAFNLVSLPGTESAGGRARARGCGCRGRPTREEGAPSAPKATGGEGTVAGMGGRTEEQDDEPGEACKNAGGVCAQSCPGFACNEAGPGRPGQVVEFFL